MTVSNLFPGYRVFIYGVEVTDDVTMVSPGMHDGRAPNQCKITLLSKDNKYMLTTKDIMYIAQNPGEGAATNVDILDLGAAADGLADIASEADKRRYLKEQGFGDALTKKLVDRIDTVSGKLKIPWLDNATIDLDINNYSMDGRKAWILKNKSALKIVFSDEDRKNVLGKFVSDKIFDKYYGRDVTKYPVCDGMPVFHPMDQVRVAMRHPEEPSRWFWMFSGFVSDIIETADENRVQTLSIVVEDPTKLLRYTRMSINPGILDSKIAIDAINDSTARSFFSNFMSGFTLQEVLFTLFFGPAKIDLNKYTSSIDSASGTAEISTRIHGVGHFSFDRSGVYVYGNKAEVNKSIEEARIKDVELDDKISYNNTARHIIERIAAEARTRVEETGGAEILGLNIIKSALQVPSHQISDTQAKLIMAATGANSTTYIPYIETMVKYEKDMHDNLQAQAKKDHGVRLTKVAGLTENQQAELDKEKLDRAAFDELMSPSASVAMKFGVEQAIIYGAYTVIGGATVKYDVSRPISLIEAKILAKIPSYEAYKSALTKIKPPNYISELSTWQWMIDNEVQPSDIHTMARDADVKAGKTSLRISALTGKYTLSQLPAPAAAWYDLNNTTTVEAGDNFEVEIPAFDIISYIGCHPEEYPVDGGRVMLLIPASFGVANSNIIMKDIIGSYPLTSEFKSYGAILYEVIDRIEFVMYCTPKGDIVIEPPLYDFTPSDFGLTPIPWIEAPSYQWVNSGEISNDTPRGPFGQRYVIKHKNQYTTETAFTDDKIATIAIGSKKIFQNWDQLPGTEIIGDITKVERPELMALFGVRMAPVTSRGYIHEQTALDIYLEMCLNKTNADAISVNVQAVPHMGMWINRPIYIESKNFLATSRQVSYSITWGSGGNMNMSVDLYAVRTWSGDVSKDNVPIFTTIGGRQSQPLNYAALFGNAQESMKRKGK